MPYKNLIRCNDLVFGLSRARTEYVLKYQVFKPVLKYPGMILNNYAVTLLERQWAAKNKTLIIAQPFLHFIKGHPKYRPALTDPYLIAEVLPHHDATEVKRRALNNPTNVTRKCKSALAWAAKNINVKTSLGYFSKGTVHYILDKINFEELIFKATIDDNYYNNLEEFKEYCMLRKKIIIKSIQRSDDPQQDLSIKNRAITGSELRWIYRNRDNPLVQRAVQFWYAGQPCCPPWDTAFDSICGQDVACLWQRYIPKSTQDDD